MSPPPLVPPPHYGPNETDEGDDGQLERPYAPVYLPIPRTTWLLPNLEFRVENLAHPGVRLFFQHINVADAMREAVVAVCSWLYTMQDAPTNVQNILLVLRPMPGVAYTTGSHTHKEIHFSVNHISDNAPRAQDEIKGVLTHEMVHCFQYNAKGTCPGGLIEGIADWVRLRAGFVPPHWKRGGGDRWDAGYQDTAYFLDWIERQTGSGTVYRLNAGLRNTSYHDSIFQDLTGSSVEELWRLYKLDVGSGP